MIFILLLGAFFFLDCNSVEAKTLFGQCEGLKGTRGDYFSKDRSSKVKEKEFIESPDAFTDYSYILLWKFGEESATLVTYSKLGKEVSGTDRLYPILVEHNQITFTGIVKGAPTMISFYPYEQVAIYTQQSSWSLVLEGVRTFQGCMRCKIEISNE